MSKIPILTFRPQFKSVLWGGSSIAAYKGLPPQGDRIGESWELSDVPGHESAVENDDFKGKNLHELMLSNGREILGERLSERFGDRFPLLVKIIDSAAPLSIQVHPDDALASRRHGCMGKTEMWVVTGAGEGAYLYAGFSKRLSPEKFMDSVNSDTFVDYLGKYFTHPGDVFFLPAGRVHSIGPGNLLIEIQQTSDITYRIYDYGRKDADGNPRQLHVHEAMEAIDFDDIDKASPLKIDWVPGQEETIADCSHFTTTVIRIDGEKRLDLNDRDSFTIIVVTEGLARLVDPEGRETVLAQGNTALVPASMSGVTICGNCKILTSFIK